jgi:hypothetical protein
MNRFTFLLSPELRRRLLLAQQQSASPDTPASPLGEIVRRSLETTLPRVTDAGALPPKVTT